MRRTSPGYDPFPAVRSPEAFVEFEVLAKALSKPEIAVSTRNRAAVGSVSQVLDGVPELKKKYATLERFGWRLDGGASVLSGEEEAGYWSRAVSDGAGQFASPLVLRMELPEPTTTFGWTFHFDAPGGIWAKKIGISCFDAGGNRIDVTESYPADAGTNGRGWSVNRFAREYSAVEFAFYGTSEPFRMLRLAEIDFGVSRHFDKDSIGEMRIRYGASPDGSAFPAKECTFTFDNSDGEFNVLDPAGVYQYWRNGQLLSARIRIGGETVDMGSFCVTRAGIGENRLTAKVTAHDECYRLAAQKFRPGALAEEESVPLGDAVAAVLDGYGMRYDLGGLGDEPVSLAIRGTHEKRTVLRYLAQAARASVWIDRDGVLRFCRLGIKNEPLGADGALTADELYSWSGAEISEEYTGVTLSVERELSDDGNGDPVIETYTAGVADDEGAFTASYENPCVAAERGQAVADWLLVTANRRKKYAVRNRCDPAVEIGDTLTIEDAFRGNGRAVVTGIDIFYDGTLYAVTEAVGEFA